MSVRVIEGDVLQCTDGYICHQVNCLGVMGCGIAKSIKQRWPIVFGKYMQKCNSGYKNLGSIQIVDVTDIFFSRGVDTPLYVINMFAQVGYGRRGVHTDYDAFESCLKEIQASVPKGSEIRMPYKIGCGLAGGNWRTIYNLIVEYLSSDFNVTIYKKAYTG